MSPSSPTPAGRTHSPTPAVSELEMEAALLRSVVDARPIGRHKHLLIIQLQGEMHRRTGLWIPVEQLWDKLEGLYDLEALDELSSSSSVSLPDSPRLLSPRLGPRRRSQRSSLSPLSDSPSPRKSTNTKKAANNRKPRRSSSLSSKKGRAPSRSAEVINSEHFKRSFDIPYFWNSGEDAEEENGENEGDGMQETVKVEEGILGDTETWREMIYNRAEDPDKLDEPWGGSLQGEVQGEEPEGDEDDENIEQLESGSEGEEPSSPGAKRRGRAGHIGKGRGKRKSVSVSRSRRESGATVLSASAAAAASASAASGDKRKRGRQSTASKRGAERESSLSEDESEEERGRRTKVKRGKEKEENHEVEPRRRTRR